MEELSRTSQIERMLKDKFICNLIGIKLEEAGKGHARSSLLLREDHLNGVGIVQGGVLYAIADYTFAAAANYSVEDVVGVETSISFLRSVKAGKIFADAEEVSRSRNFSVCTVRVTDESGKLLAMMNARGYLLQPR